MGQRYGGLTPHKTRERNMRISRTTARDDSSLGDSAWYASLVLCIDSLVGSRRAGGVAYEVATSRVLDILQRDPRGYGMIVQVCV
jgi:hypothetical protein